MKRTILFFALILGMSGFMVAQSCGNGYGYSGYDYYYTPVNNYNNLGIIKSKFRGHFDRNVVVDARLTPNGRKRISIEYVFDNGDILVVQAKKGHGHRGTYGSNSNGATYRPRTGSYGTRVGNNYHYNSNGGGLAWGDFQIHCATLNGRDLPVRCGTLTIQRGNRNRVKTYLDLEVGRRGRFTGDVKVFV